MFYVIVGVITQWILSNQNLFIGIVIITALVMFVVVGRSFDAISAHRRHNEIIQVQLQKEREEQRQRMRREAAKNAEGNRRK